jgi:hypothetical protein
MGVKVVLMSSVTLWCARLSFILHCMIHVEASILSAPSCFRTSAQYS